MHPDQPHATPPHDAPRGALPRPPAALGKLTARAGAVSSDASREGLGAPSEGVAQALRNALSGDADADSDADPQRDPHRGAHYGAAADDDTRADPTASARAGDGRPVTPMDDRPLPGPSSRSAQELEPIWRAVLDVLASQVQREQFDTWFPRTALRGIDDRRVTVAVPNGFTSDWLQSYYRRVIDGAIAQVLGSDHVATFVVDPELMTTRPAADRHRHGSRLDDAGLSDDERADSSTGTGAGSGARRDTHDRRHGRDGDDDDRSDRTSAARPRDGGASGSRNATRLGLMSASDFGLNTNYRFENFVVGPCNRFAHAAAFGVSESPGKTYNPFFLHGNVGLGKTHLMQSLCHALLDRDPNVRILYLSCETFVNHFINALENGDLQKFRNKYRNVDVLVVDDIHLLANKERTQEEFFHTFNALYNAGKQIVLSSDSPPKDIPSLQGRLVSRFKWGLVTEIEPPCYETRMAILKRKSRDRGTELPDDVARMLAERIDSNIRELEGAITKVLGFAGLAKLPVTVELARECLRDVFAQRVGAPTMEDVLRVVTEQFGVRLSDLQSRKRTAQIAHARQVGMYLARQVTRLSLEEIGGFFGGRDHSTVLYAIQKVSGNAKSDAGMQDVLGDLLARLRGRS